MNEESINVEFSFSFLSCNFNGKHSNPNRFVEFFYFRSNKHFFKQINCTALRSKMFEKEINYLKVNDIEYLNQFTTEFNNLKTSKLQKDIDTRIQVVFDNKKRIDTICMGNHFGIKVNGTNKVDAKIF